MHHKPKTIFFTLEVIPIEIIGTSPLTSGLVLVLSSLSSAKQYRPLKKNSNISFRNIAAIYFIVLLVVYFFDFLVFVLAVALLLDFLFFEATDFLDFDLDLDFEYLDFFALDFLLDFFAYDFCASAGE